METEPLLEQSGPEGNPSGRPRRRRPDPELSIQIVREVNAVDNNVGLHDGEDRQPASGQSGRIAVLVNRHQNRCGSQERASQRKSPRGRGRPDPPGGHPERVLRDVEQDPVHRRGKERGNRSGAPVRESGPDRNPAGQQQPMVGVEGDPQLPKLRRGKAGGDRERKGLQQRTRSGLSEHDVSIRAPPPREGQRRKKAKRGTRRRSRASGRRRGGRVPHRRCGPAWRRRP